PGYIKESLSSIVRDHDKVYLRVVEVMPVKSGNMTVLSSEPLDQRMLLKLAEDLGEISLYGTGLTLSKVEKNQAPTPKQENDQGGGARLIQKNPEGDYVLDTEKNDLVPTSVAGTAPPAARNLDLQVKFATTLPAMNWDSGDTSAPIGISVQTRLS